MGEVTHAARCEHPHPLDGAPTTDPKRPLGVGAANPVWSAPGWPGAMDPVSLATTPLSNTNQGTFVPWVQTMPTGKEAINLTAHV